MKKIILPIVCLIALIAGFASSFLGQNKAEKLDIAGFMLPTPEPLSDFTLTNHVQEPIDQSYFNGSWTFVYAGYTFCPDACPISLTVLQQVHELHNDVSTQHPLRSMLVSVDPQRDTPERLNEYVKYFNQDFIGGTGSDEQLKNFTRQIKAVYSLPKDTSTEDYLVDHSSSIVLINPDAALHAIFTPPQKASQIASDLEKIIAAYKG